MCTCGGLKGIRSYDQLEYTMSFLMSLNDTYSHIRGQILLMDPLPHLTKSSLCLLKKKDKGNVDLHKFLVQN